MIGIFMVSDFNLMCPLKHSIIIQAGELGISFKLLPFLIAARDQYPYKDNHLDLTYEGLNLSI